jgi:hypothetical protein
MSASQNSFVQPFASCGQTVPHIDAVGHSLDEPAVEHGVLQ